MTDSISFKKAQIYIAVNKKETQKDNISNLSVDVGYPDSTGEYVWKSSSRVFDKKTKLFLKTINNSGKETYSIYPSSWENFEYESKQAVFDFVKNDCASKIKIRLYFYTEKKNLSQTKEFEILEAQSKILIPYLKVKIFEKNIGED